MKEQKPPEKSDPKAFERFKNLTRQLLGAKKMSSATSKKTAKQRRKRG